jgi:UDP:flavonoid glycosyltransferase YjiC (YdhE family)
MRIAIIATGSRGDVQPYIALGKGLAAAGFEVRLVTHINYDDLVCSHGVEFWPIAGDVQAIVQNQDMRQRLETGNFLGIMAQMAKEAKQAAIHLAESGLAACAGVDLILGGMGGEYIGVSLAEKFGLPFIRAYLVPFTPTRAFPSVLAPGLPQLAGGVVNRLSHHLTRQVMWQGFRSADKVSRRQVLNLPAAPVWGPYNSPHFSGMPTLYGFSPAVLPTPPDWGADVHITGYWFLDSASDWTPPLDLVDFLQAGPKPVYIGFGSMSSRKPEETANLVIDAMEQCDQRAVLLSGWGGLHKTDLPDSILMVDSVPHTWLFPHMAAVVHHGGVGTTAAGLRAGVPSLVIPFFGDQPFWGKRVASLGVGPDPIPRKKLTSKRLARAIHEAVTDTQFQQRAADLGAKIQAEDGVARGVEIIQQLTK